MDNEPASLIYSKFRQTEIKYLLPSDPYFVLCIDSDISKIYEDLTLSGFVNFLGYIATKPAQQIIEVDASINQVSFDTVRNRIDKGAHLVLTANVFSHLLDLSNFREIKSWRNRIHFARILDWFADRTRKDIYRNDFTNWAYNHMMEGHTHDSADLLALFLEMYGPQELDAEARFKYLADIDNSGLSNGKIATIFNAGADLKKGWLFYKDAVGIRITQACAPLPYPLWNGENFCGKKIVFRREHGPADEIIYSHVFKDLIKDGCQVIIEVDQRLVGLFERSFPGAEVIPRLNPDAHPRLFEKDVDFQANYSDPFLIYRDSLEKFPDHSGYLVPDTHHVSKWKAYFDKLFPNVLRIGIFWQSQGTSIVSNRMKTDLRQWSSALTQSGVQFINLDYSDVEADLLWVRDKLGVVIHEIEDFDIFNDLEGLTAVIANLDLVISVPGINSPLAGAVDTPVWEIAPKFWHLLFGQSYSPFYPRVRVFELTKSTFNVVSETLAKQVEIANASGDLHKCFRSLSRRTE